MLPKIVNLIAAVFLAFALLLIFADAMAKPLSRDENMYCSAAVLLSEGKTIYKDFSYVAQLPYHPLLLAATYKITGTTYYLLTARIVTCLADFLTVLFIILIYRKIFSAYTFSGLLFGFASALLFLFNPLINFIVGLAWNHNIVICCVIISFWLYLSFDGKGKTDYWKTALMVALLTIATCMRITTALVEVLFFIVMLFGHYKSSKDKIVNISVFVLSFLLVIAWPCWVIAQSPKAFFWNLFQIPILNNQLLTQMGLFYDKLPLTFLVLATPEYLFPLLIAIYIYWRLFRNRKQAGITSSVYLAVLLPIVFFIIAFIPTSMWVQYLAIPIPFLLISLAFPLLHLRRSTESPHFKIASSLITACVIIAVFEQISILFPLNTLSQPRLWSPVRLHVLAEKMTQDIDKSGPVLTISPLYALEGSCRIYPQLSAGLFVYRIADNMTEQERQITKVVGPASLKRLTAETPPAAVITGSEFDTGFSGLEDTLLTVVGADWTKQSFENGLTVYYKPKTN
jgi:hypothetical protein